MTSLEPRSRRRDPIHIPGAYTLVGAAVLPVSGAAHPLRREAARWLELAALSVLVLSFAGEISWQWQERSTLDTAPVHLPVFDRKVDIGVPPSIAREAATTSASLADVAVELPQLAVPEPVDDASITATIPSVEEIARLLGPLTTDNGPGGSVVAPDAPPAPRAPVGDPGGSALPDDLPVRLGCTAPVYPAMARAAGVEGVVTLNVLVGKDGRARRVVFVSGPGMLRDAAIASAQSAIFRPASAAGRPVEVWVSFPVAFRLRAAAGR